MTKTLHVERRRKAHHAALETLAHQVGCTASGLDLWRKLRRLEASLYAVCENYTNGTGGVTTEDWQRAKDAGRLALAGIFGGKLPAGLFINGDPRGHMLKLDCGSAGEPGVPIPEGMECDWGGDGILAAEID